MTSPRLVNWVPAKLATISIQYPWLKQECSYLVRFSFGFWVESAREMGKYDKRSLVLIYQNGVIIGTWRFLKDIQQKHGVSAGAAAAMHPTTHAPDCHVPDSHASDRHLRSSIRTASVGHGTKANPFPRRFTHKAIGRIRSSSRFTQIRLEYRNSVYRKRTK